MASPSYEKNTIMKVIKMSKLNTEPKIEKYKTIVSKKWYIQGFNGCANFTFAAPQSGLVDCYNNLGYG